MFPTGHPHFVEGRVHAQTTSGKERAARSASPEVVSPRTADRIAHQAESPPTRSYSESSLQKKRPRADRSLFEPAPKAQNRAVHIIRANSIEESANAQRIAREHYAARQLEAERKELLEFVDHCESRMSLVESQQLEAEMMLNDIANNEAAYLSEMFVEGIQQIRPHLRARLDMNMMQHDFTKRMYERTVNDFILAVKLPQNASAGTIRQRHHFLNELVAKHHDAVKLAERARSAASSSHGPSYIRYVMKVESSKATVRRSEDRLRRLGVPPEMYSNLI